MAYHEETVVQIMRSMLTLGATFSHDTLMSVVKPVFEIKSQRTTLSVVLEIQLM